MHNQKIKKISKKRKKQTKPKSHYLKNNYLTVYFSKLIEKKKIR
jgi:hypothetical protein